MSFTLDLTGEQEELRAKTHAFAGDVIRPAAPECADTDPLDQRMDSPRESCRSSPPSAIAPAAIGPRHEPRSRNPSP